ncbi:MAG TPA: DUF4157 domain-containing protein [Stellaceae bacterium]|nr:DUF4157 domain-containing protein [Stellaceae bacterium]
MLTSPGTPLGRDARAFFEPRFGRSFADVRVHADANAARSAAAIDALAYSVGSHIVLATGAAEFSSPGQRRLLAHELAHVVQQSGPAEPVLRRQPKPHTIGGPLDLKPDVCITLPDPIGKRCGQEAADLCKKFDSPPALCGPICAVFDCSKPKEPKTLCPPKWRAATSKEFAGQCCQGGIDSAERCCTPDRIAWAEDRCCPAGTIVVDNHCKNTSDLPPIDPGMLCPPDRRTTAGACCIPPMVPQGEICAVPPSPATGPSVSDQPPPQLGILWTDEVHFRQDHPAIGETSAAAVLTPEGQRELESVLSWLDLSPDLQVRLIGHASSEGTDDYNQALATRRVGFILAALAAHGLADRVAEPLLGDGAETGCQKLGDGRWSCGEMQADQSAARPQDRVVRVTFARNSLPPLRSEPLKPPRPLRF